VQVGRERRSAAVDVAKVLKDAWQAVLDSGVPKELQETALNRAIDLYAGPPAGQPPIIAPPKPAHSPSQPPPSGTGAPTPPPDQSTNDEDTFYDKLAKETEVPRERLEGIVHLEDGVPKMAINPKKLPDGKKGGQLFIARVILTARHVWLGETETPLSEVRAECERYGVYDRNFATHVKSIDVPGLTRTGSGQSQKVKVRKNYVSGFGEFLNQTLDE
jgi:hypothetical protein